MGRRLKRMQEGVDEVISLINSRHGVGSFDGDIQRIADEAFTDCHSLMKNAATLRGWAFMRISGRCLMNGLSIAAYMEAYVQNKKAPSAKGASKGLFGWAERGLQAHFDGLLSLHSAYSL